uniref:Sigma factor n=1 Tax=Staphylococcus felis TaxID=46127 RepID=A9YUT6_9STAP|nr:sigma factor [Staphylococcus felis]
MTYFRYFDRHLPSDSDPYQYDFLIKHIAILAQKGMKDYSIRPCDYDDMVQEAVWAIYEKLKQKNFHNDIPIDHYINRAVHMRKVYYRRRKLRHIERHTDYVNEQSTQLYLKMQSQSYSTEDQLYADDIKACIERHFNEMSSFETQVFNYLVKEWTPIEIATHLNVKNKQVYNAIYRIRRKLKKVLRTENLFDN